MMNRKIEKKKLFRILSLSGGGARGIYQAVFLKKLAFHLPSPLKSNFDFIAGTSTGALVGAALACDIDLARVVQFYEQEAARIFTGRPMSWARKGPHYDSTKLAIVLKAIFGDRKIEECSPSVLIPATTLDDFTPTYFTNYEGNGYKNPNLKRKIVDVLLASAAAPSYFAPARVGDSTQTYVDGGLWANSPSLIAATTAHGLVRIKYENMRVLSVGNGRNAKGKLGSEFITLRPYGRHMVKSVIEMMFETQEHMANIATRELIGLQNFIEINSYFPNGVIHLDDATSANAWLPPLAESRARETWLAIMALLGINPPALGPITMLSAPSVASKPAPFAIRGPARKPNP